MIMHSAVAIFLAAGASPDAYCVRCADHVTVLPGKATSGPVRVTPRPSVYDVQLASTDSRDKGPERAGGDLYSAALLPLMTLLTVFPMEKKIANYDNLVIGLADFRRIDQGGMRRICDTAGLGLCTAIRLLSPCHPVAGPIGEGIDARTGNDGGKKCHFIVTGSSGVRPNGGG